MGGNGVLSFSSVSQNWFLGGEGAGRLRKFQRREQPIQRKNYTMQQEPWRRPKIGLGWWRVRHTHTRKIRCLFWLWHLSRGVILVRTFSGRGKEVAQNRTPSFNTHTLSSLSIFDFLSEELSGESEIEIWNVLTIFPNVFKWRKEKLTSLL